MDVNGAAALQRRIEQHQHWRRAAAVVEGRQPPTDPDADELEEIGDDVRIYRPQLKWADIDGTATPVRRRLRKRLVEGRWEASIDVDAVDPAEQPLNPG